MSLRIVAALNGSHQSAVENIKANVLYVEQMNSGS